MNRAKAEQILLDWGFKQIPTRKEAIKSFGLNYCEHCKRVDVIVDFENSEGDWFFFETPGMSGSDPLGGIKSFIKELKEYGILKSRKPKKV